MGTVETEVYRCPVCGVAWFGSSVTKRIEKKKLVCYCPQTGHRLRRITNTKKGQALLKLRNEINEDLEKES